MARAHNDQEHSFEILPINTRLLYFLTTNFLFFFLLLSIILLFFHWSSKYHYFLPLSSFPIFTPIGNHVPQFNVRHRNTGYN